MKIFLPFLLVATALLAGNSTSNYGIEENISAIVGNDVILSTEVDMALLVQTGGEFPSDSATYKKMRQKVLDGLIEDKLLLIAAKMESVIVDSGQVNKVFEERWGKIRGQFPTDEALQQAIAKEGYTLGSFKRNLRKQIRENLLKQNFIYSHFGEQELTPSELDSFYNTYKDSLPEKPGYVDLKVIVLHPKGDSALVKNLLSVASEARESLAKSKNAFTNVADKLSAKYPSLTIEAGKIGPYGKGDLTAVLDKAAFSVPVAEWSEPIIAPTGIYVIRPTQRDESTVSLDYIRVSSSATSIDAGFQKRAMDLYSRLVAYPDSFDIFVRLYSDDTTTANQGGSLGRFSTSDLDPHIKQYIPHAQKGDLLPPWVEDQEIDIFKIVDIQAGHRLTMSEDADIIKQIAANEKLTSAVKKYLKRVRQKVFVKITGK